MINWSFMFQMINSIANIAVVLSLIYLIIQTKLFRNSVKILQEQTDAEIDASRAANHAGLREVMFKINEVFLAKPEIRKYFYEGIPIDKNNPDYDYAETTAELLLDIMEHMLWQASAFPTLYGSSPDDLMLWDVWERYTVDMFVSSPLLMEYAQKKRTWYTPHILERMELAQSILNETDLIFIAKGFCKVRNKVSATKKAHAACRTSFFCGRYPTSSPPPGPSYAVPQFLAARWRELLRTGRTPS